MKADRRIKCCRVSYEHACHVHTEVLVVCPEKCSFTFGSASLIYFMRCCKRLKATCAYICVCVCVYIRICRRITHPRANSSSSVQYMSGISHTRRARRFRYHREKCTYERPICFLRYNRSHFFFIVGFKIFLNPI